MSSRERLALAAVLIGACWLFRIPLEQDPVSHVLVQLPLLALAGAIAATALSELLRWSPTAWNAGGFATLLIAIFAIAFWMLPRSIDAALIDERIAFAKFVTVPGLIGAPLIMGWRRAHPLLRGFIKAQSLSMLGFLAFLYTHAPVRICNAYLVADQERLGLGFLAAALICAFVWALPVFVGPTGRSSRAIAKVARS